MGNRSATMEGPHLRTITLSARSSPLTLRSRRASWGSTVARAWPFARLSETQGPVTAPTPSAISIPVGRVLRAPGLTYPSQDRRTSTAPCPIRPGTPVRLIRMPMAWSIMARLCEV